jgi:hypothetical protein
MEKEALAKPSKIFYNVEMARRIREIKAPYKGLIVDIRARPAWLAVVIYEENIMEYEVDQRVNIMEYLMMIRDIIQSYGVRCELEGLKHREKPQS